MTGIGERLLDVQKSLPDDVQLVAVSKFHPNKDVLEAYDSGQRIFGENIVQELKEKHATLPQDIQWHFIGHLQTNKVKYIAPFVSLIHSVDSFKLLQEINKQALNNNRTIPCLLQIHVAKEETKFGFTFEECTDLLQGQSWKELSNIQICGLMCMASNVSDTDQIHREFRSVKDFFDKLKKTVFQNDTNFKYRSWGMSHDYLVAIQEGSNLVRVGSRIFGPRPQAL